MSELKLVRIICVLLGAAILLTGCGTNTGETPINEMTFLYEKEGFEGDFTITLRSDGTFSYYEGWASSYYATGNWTEEEGIIVLKDDGSYAMVNRFEHTDDTLVFIGTKSTGFMYVDVDNGDTFTVTDKEHVIPDFYVNAMALHKNKDKEE